MFTEIKTRKAWEDLITPQRQKKASNSLQDELIGYSFLRNIWGTYFFDRQQISSEDKIDNINKIVGMMKAQIKLMINYQSNLIDRSNDQSIQNQGLNKGLNSLQAESEKIKQELQRSRMREEELNMTVLKKQQQKMSLEQQNKKQRQQIILLKQDKKKCEQRLIQLSNKVYQLQRGCYFNASTQSYRLHDIHNTLDQLSAITIDREFSAQKPPISLFAKTQNQYHEVHSEQEDDQNQYLCQLNLNFAKNKNPLKHSLQFYDKVRTNNDVDFIQEMKRMRLKTQRIVEIQNDRKSLRDDRRKTFTSNALKFNGSVKQSENECRRFRRIRC